MYSSFLIFGRKKWRSPYFSGGIISLFLEIRRESIRGKMPIRLDSRGDSKSKNKNSRFLGTFLKILSGAQAVDNFVSLFDSFKNHRALFFEITFPHFERFRMKIIKFEKRDSTHNRNRANLTMSSKTSSLLRERLQSLRRRVVKVRRSGFLGVQSLGLLGRLKGPKSPGINVTALRLVVAHIKRLVVAHSKTFERAVTENYIGTLLFGSRNVGFSRFEVRRVVDPHDKYADEGSSVWFRGW